MDIQTASLAIASLIVTIIGSIYIPLYLYKKMQTKLTTTNKRRTKKGH